MIVTHTKSDDDQDAFVNLIDTSVDILKDESNKNPVYFLSRSGTKLEDDIAKIMESSAANTVFEGNIEQISGQRFPDIVAKVNENKAYGLEVKTTTKDHWTSTGSSIFEGTRVENVDRIYLLFGKLFEPIDYKYRKYEECLTTVAITHSPRYKIDMEINAEDTIFSKVGVDYDTLRKLQNPFSPIKDYFRNNLKDKNEDIWWFDQYEEKTANLAVRLWANLRLVEKNNLRVEAFAHFPGLFGNNNKKYSRLATWLASHHGIINPSLRDTFTAGGQEEMFGHSFPKIFIRLKEEWTDILNKIENLEEEDIKFYWDIKNITKSKKDTWLDLCLSYSKEQLNTEQLKLLSNYLRNSSG